MTIAYISAGSNLGDRKAFLDFGARSLAEKGMLLRRSSVFETEPVGYAEQPWFLNQVFELKTDLAPQALLARCNAIELEAGRVRTFRNAPRPLDLDILLYGNEVICDPNLIIPHPRMVERRFVLEPLVEIAPNLSYPTTGISIRELLKNCPDTTAVHKIEDEK